jgi:hypothetical protein
LHSIKQGIILTYCVSNNIFENTIIKFGKKNAVLEERLISQHLPFAQIRKLYNFGQFKLHGSIINMPANIDKTQLLFSHLPEDGTSIGILFKHSLEYKTLYTSRNLQFNLTMIVLKDKL